MVEMPEKSVLTILLERIADSNRLSAQRADQLLRAIRRRIRRFKLLSKARKFFKL